MRNPLQQIVIVWMSAFAVVGLFVGRIDRAAAAELKAGSRGSI